MTFNQRKIEDYLEQKLRRGEVKNTSADFPQLVMRRVQVEHSLVVKEARRERKIKWSIFGFISFTLLFTFFVTFFSKSSGKDTTDTRGFNLNPAIETSTGLADRLVGYIEAGFSYILSLLGLSLSSQTMKLVMIIGGIVLLFFLVERFILRSKLKSISHTG